MIRREPLKALFLFAMLLGLLDLLLLMSGYRILVSEVRGEAWTNPGSWLPAEKEGDTLSCKYFTGRSVLTVEFGPILAVPDECRFFYKPDHD